MQQPTTLEKPDFAPKWFWDFDYEKIDWQASFRTVIARIIERGKEEKWQELVRFYGLQKVVDTLKNEIVFLPDYAIEEASTYFDIKKEEMLLSFTMPPNNQDCQNRITKEHSTDTTALTFGRNSDTTVQTKCSTRLASSIV